MEAQRRGDQGRDGRTYKLVSADRGKKLSVTATAKRYGYTTGSDDLDGQVDLVS